MTDPFPAPAPPGCRGWLNRLFGSTTARDSAEISADAALTYPYQLRDDFLSPAELSFYHVLRHTVGQTATICVKVSLGDLFYPKTGRWADNQAYRNKITPATLLNCTNSGDAPMTNPAAGGYGRLSCKGLPKTDSPVHTRCTD